MKKRKLLSVLLALVMVLSLLPTVTLPASAAGGSDTPAIASLNLYGDVSRAKSIPLSPAFSSDIHEYTIDLPDYLNSSVYAVGSSANTGDYLKTELRTPWGSSSKALLPTTISNLFKYDKIPFRVGPADNLNADNGDTVYSVALNKRLTLKTLKVNDTLQPAYNRDITSYTAGIDKDAESFSVSLECFSFPCTVTINGTDVKWGGSEKTYSFPLNWNSDGKMPVEIKLSNGTVTSVYNLMLIKETAESTPVISVNPQSASYDDIDTAAPLKVRATANGTLSYKWFRNAENTTSGGTEIAGATDASYTPEIPDVSKITTDYYYCEVTNTAEGGGSAVSEIAALTVYPDATPAVTCATEDGSALPGKYEYNVGDTPVGLKVQATSGVPGGVFLYSWKQGQKNSPSNITNFSENNSFSPYTSADGETMYFCTVTYLVNGRRYSADSEQFPPVRVYESSAAVPYISNQPSGAVYNVGETEIEELYVGAFPEGSKPGEITYQWLSSSDGKTFEPIDGAVSDSYLPPAMTKGGTAYYKCSLTNTFTSISGTTYTSHADSAVAVIRFLDSYTEWAGKGTDAEPFQIADVQDLEELRSYVNTGVSFEGYYFEMTGDITLPANWVPIGSLKDGSSNPSDGANINPFSASFDGKNHTLTIPKDGKAPFGYVRMASISNLNLFGEQINGAALINNYTVDYGPSGNYSNVPAYIAKIDKVTLKGGSKTSASGLVDGNGSGMNNIFFTNCTVESGVTVGYGKNQSNVGSFISCLNGNMLGCVSYADVYGVGNVGGLAGSKGQSMGDCTIWDSSFHGTITATGDFAGGIMGSGYNVESAPNSPCVSIQNCYVTGKVTGSDHVGGIFGGEGGVKECWPNGIGYIQNNYLSGTVSGSGSSVGGVIGYMQSLDRYNIISNNFYVEGCGAAKGIGTVVAVCTPDTPASVNGWTHLSGGIKYGRADDPTGTGADKLAKAIPASSLTDGTLLSALNSGVNSSGDWVNDASAPVFGKKTHVINVTVNGLGISMGSISIEGGNTSLLNGKTVTATYSDGTQETVGIDKATVSGYDADTIGYKLVTVTYKNHTFVFELYVRSAKPTTPTDTINVSFTLLGDALHGEGGTAHTLSGNNLTTWIAQNTVTVSKDATVMDVLANELSANGYSWMNENVKDGCNGNYIQSITTPGGVKLGEFDNGNLSGWMYTLNKTHPLLGVKQQYLKDGDAIVFHYTDDYTKEEGSEKWNDSGSTPGSGSKIEPETVISGDNATVSIPETSVTSAIEAVQKSGEKTITIVPKDTGSATNISITIPKTAAKSVVDGTKAAVKIETGNGSVTIPNETLASIVKQASGDDVKISVEKKTAADIADETIDAQNAVIAAITVASNGKAITSFGGERLTVGIPVDSGYTAGQSYKVIILSADGTREITSGKCVSADGKLTVEVSTKHLSTFIVTKEKSVGFTDVKEGIWYYDAVQYAVSNGLFQGYSDTTFAPDDAMTRAMLVTVLYRMEKSPAVTGASTFTDVKAGQWYTDAVLWAQQNKLVTGYDDATFGPDDPVNREQMATILYRYAQSKKYDVSVGKDTNLLSYTDAMSVSEYAMPAMQWACGARLINGSDGKLMPRGDAQRAQVAAILMRFAQNVAK